MTNQPLDLDAIEARANAATPGPWKIDSSIPYGHRVGSSDDADWVARTGEYGETGSEADAAYIAAVNPAVALALVAEVRHLRAGQPTTPIDPTALAGLLAFHTGKLAATFRLYLSTELPGYRAGMDRVVALLDLHKEQLLAGRWPDDVQRMLTAMVGALTDEGAASMRRDGFGLDEIADMLSRPAAVPAVGETGE